MKFLKKQKPSSIYGTSPQYNTKQKVLGASAGLIILLFIIFSLFGGRSSSPSISTSGSKKSPDTKELKLNQSKHTLGVSNFAISTPEGFDQNKDDDFLKNNSGKVLFRKSASGTQYDFISVNKRSSEAKENTLLTIEKQLKTFATALIHLHHRAAAREALLLPEVDPSVFTTGARRGPAGTDEGDPPEHPNGQPPPRTGAVLSLPPGPGPRSGSSLRA